MDHVPGEGGEGTGLDHVPGVEGVRGTRIDHVPGVEGVRGAGMDHVPGGGGEGTGMDHVPGECRGPRAPSALSVGRRLPDIPRQIG